MTPPRPSNSVTERNDRTRGGKKLLACVDSGASDTVLPKSVCTQYPLEATPKSQSGVGVKRSKRVTHQALRVETLSSQDKRPKQYEHHVGGRTCAQTADLRQPSAFREVTSLYWMRSRGSSANMETPLRLRGPVLCSPYGCGFRRVFTGRAEHKSQHEKKACKTMH